MLLLPSSRPSLLGSCGSGLLFPIYPFSHSFPLLPGALIFSLLKSHFPQGSALSFPFSFYTIAGWSQPISCLRLPRLVGSAPALSLRAPQPRVSNGGVGAPPRMTLPPGPQPNGPAMGTHKSQANLRSSEDDFPFRQDSGRE